MVSNDESDAFPGYEFVARNDQASARRLHPALKRSDRFSAHDESR